MIFLCWYEKKEKKSFEKKYKKNKHNAKLQRKPPPANQLNMLYTLVVISHGITILKYTITLNQYV